MSLARFIVADVFDGLATLDDGSVDLVVTSPPFLALRSYLPADHPDKAKEIGSESTPAEFLDVLLEVTAELRRVLAPHGSIAIELGDTYSGSGGAGGDYTENGLRAAQEPFRGSAYAKRYEAVDGRTGPGRTRVGHDGWPLPKSVCMIPEAYRFALAYGHNPFTGQPSPAGQWRVRNKVTWARPNPPVGALGDKWRPATSDLVVACVSEKRYWDDLATRHHNPRADESSRTRAQMNRGGVGYHTGDSKDNAAQNPAGAPLLDYWEIPPTGYKGSHYAVFPPELVEPCVKAMGPQRVCRTCGEPSRRIVEPGYVPDNSGGTGRTHRDATEPDGNERGIHSPDAKRMSVAHKTVGWTECGHGAGCRATTWTMIEVPVEQGRVRGGKWVDLDKWELPIDPTETRVKVKRRRVVDDIGECADQAHYRPGLILDPFAGSGTTLMVATGHGLDAVGIDLDERNAVLAEQRVGGFFFERVGVRDV